MLFKKRGFDLGVKAVHEVFTPQSECLGVVASDIANLLHNKCPLRFDADVVDQLRDRREVAAREDVMVDEAVKKSALAARTLQS